MTKNRSLWVSLLFIASAFIVSSCATGPPPGPSPAQIAGQKARTIVVAPLNVVSSLPPELEGSTKIVSTALVEQLEWRVDRKGGDSGRETVSQELVNDTPAIQDNKMIRAGVTAALSPFLPEEKIAPAETSDAEPS